MKRRWLVIVEAYGPIYLIGGFPPYREFIYYRWRWYAKLACWARNHPIPGVCASYYDKARLMGRVSEKSLMPWWYTSIPEELMHGFMR